MPILQYKCKKCGKKFEELVKSYTDKMVCPDCGGETERDYEGPSIRLRGKSPPRARGTVLRAAAVIESSRDYIYNPL